MTPMLTPQAIATATGLSYHAVLRAIHSGELRATKLRARIVVRQEWFDEWVDQGVITPATAAHPLRLAEHAPRARRRPQVRGSLDRLRSIEAGGSES